MDGLVSSYLYHSIVSSIIKTTPRALFPVFRRDLGLGLFPFCSLTSFRSWRALRAGCSDRSLVPFVPISSIEPGNSRDTWYAVGCAKRLDLQSQNKNKLIKILFFTFNFFQSVTFSFLYFFIMLLFLCYKGAMLWNSLSHKLRSTVSLSINQSYIEFERLNPTTLGDDTDFTFHSHEKRWNRNTTNGAAPLLK